MFLLVPLRSQLHCDAPPASQTHAVCVLFSGSSALGGVLSAYASGAALSAVDARVVFGWAAVFPLLVAAIASLIEEDKVPGVFEAGLAETASVVRARGELLFEAVRRPQVLLPVAFLFCWLATPSSESAFFYFLTNDLQFSPEFLGRVRLAGSLASLAGVVIFNRFLRDVPVDKVLFWTTILALPPALLQLALVTHVNRDILHVSDEFFTLGDDVVLATLGQVGFMPTLVLAARLCPPGVEGTLFALLMSVYNGASIVGSELGAVLTKMLGVTETDFTNLPQLILLCNLSSLLPLPFLGVLRNAIANTEESIDVDDTAAYLIETVRLETEEADDFAPPGVLSGATGQRREAKAREAED